MRYVILGAGAIGGALGGRLVDAGHEVALLARGDHADALRTDGLIVHTPEGTLQVQVDVAESPDELRLQPHDVLVLAVKSQQTQALLDGIAGVAVAGGGTAADTLPLICAQNGVVNELTALRRFARVYGSCVMCPAQHLEPGVVVANGAPFTGSFDTGRYPGGIDDVVTTFVRDVSGSRCIATARENVMAWKYAKLLRNLANATDALLPGDLDETDQAVVDGIARRARDEARACFTAAGITHVGDEEWAGYRFDEAQPHPIEGRPRGGSSTWQSVSRGTGNVEADFLNGEVVLLGRRYGVGTPVNLGLQRGVNALVAAGGKPGDVSVAELADAVA